MKVSIKAKQISLLFLLLFLVYCLSTNTCYSLTEADELLESGKYEEAKHAFELMLQDRPQDEHTLNQLAICYSLLRQYDKAETIFQKLAQDSSYSSDTVMDLASSYFHKGKYAEALKLCSKAEKQGPGTRYTQAVIHLAKAEMLYRLNRLREAETSYHNALDSLNLQDQGLVVRLALAGLAGCYWQEKDYQQAATTYENLANVNKALYGDADLDYGWSLLQLSDAYKKLGNDGHKPLYEKSVWIFRKANRDRLLQEYAEEIGNDKDGFIKKRIERYVYGEGDRKEYEDADKCITGTCVYLEKTNSKTSMPPCPWGHRFKQTNAPGWVWINPLLPQRAILVCVHGLGLHNRSYESFARRVALEGVTTISFDVRGFGSYLQAKGMERLDMEGCVDDLRTVLGVIRRDNPDVPLFLLGESMGGAIALRLAALGPELIDGLICSVPSGSRYKSAETALDVGLHYLKNKNQLFDIGEKVVNQATSESELREKWINDPANRLKLSAKELIEFQRFMDQNPAYAKKITNKPVIIFQGNEDRLVKEAGTYQLFEVVEAPEKILVLLGETEHLVFEAGQFKDDVTLGVLGWMNAHAPQKLSGKDISSN